MTVTLHSLTHSHPPDMPVPAEAIVEQTRSGERPPLFVVLDDDPTGTQSVTNLPVLTGWGEQDFAWAFATGAPAVYVMTNSRSLSADDAERVNREVAAAAQQAVPAGRELVLASRSDSTLRGHFPLEPDVLADILERDGAPVDGILIVPAFGDAGRITVDGVHYAGSERDGYLPVGQTEFAKDKTFGYTSSKLADWVEEKGGGDSGEVRHISLTSLRSDREAVAELLRSCTDRAVIVSDAVTENDLRRLALVLNEAEKAGKRFIYRVGPPFMRARLGQEIAAPLEREDIAELKGGGEALAKSTTPGGLVVIGSHVSLTTRQLEHLAETMDPQRVEIDARQVIGNARQEHLDDVVSTVLDGLQAGHVVVATSREVIAGKDRDDSLRIARDVSSAVVEVVSRTVEAETPRFVIAKGGITSSDVATKGLSMRRATVVGPMLPGIVSLWAAGDGPAEGIPYIVFAGNVGDETSLSKVAEKLSAERTQS